MFRKNLMLAGLMKQQQILNRLIHELAGRPDDVEDHHRDLYDKTARQVERNFKKLRRLTQNYFEFQEN